MFDARLVPLSGGGIDRYPALAQAISDGARVRVARVGQPLCAGRKNIQLATHPHRVLVHRRLVRTQGINLLSFTDQLRRLEAEPDEQSADDKQEGKEYPA